MRRIMFVSFGVLALALAGTAEASRFVLVKQYPIGPYSFYFALTDEGVIWRSRYNAPDDWGVCGQPPTVDQVVDVVIEGSEVLDALTAGGQIWRAQLGGDTGPCMGWTNWCTLTATAPFVGFAINSDGHQLYAITSFGEIVCGSIFNCNGWGACGRIEGATTSVEPSVLPSTWGEIKTQGK